MTCSTTASLLMRAPAEGRGREGVYQRGMADYAHHQMRLVRVLRFCQRRAAGTKLSGRYTCYVQLVTS